MKHITVRLRDGEDLRERIEKIAKEHNAPAGCILSVVGSLSKTNLRTPVLDPENITFKKMNEPVEIVSGTGTLAKDDLHVHLSVSDSKGRVWGGHLSKGNIVRTTAEVVILIFDDVTYKRVHDPETGYEELEIEDG